MDKISLDEFPVQTRSRFLAANLFAGADLGMWSFGRDRELYYSTCSNVKEFSAFLELSGCMEFLYQNLEAWKKPVILSDQLGLIWIAEDMYSGGELQCLLLIGPMFLSKVSVKSIEDSLRERISSIFMQRQMMRTISAVPVITLPMMYQYAKMLHYSMTSERIWPADFIYQSEETRRYLQGEDEEASALIQSDPERVMTGERLILQAVRDGNLNYKELIKDRKDFENELISRSENFLRDAKNTLLILNALCSRAAVQGGLSAKTAREVELRYTAQIEKADIITELQAVRERFLEEYIRKVREGKANPLISKSVRECCDYIRANVTKELTVQSIASELGYAPYYFSKKFYRETGVKISDYIKQARVDYARIVLLSSKKSIQEISDLLHFGTRNYFCKVFHDLVGMTPAAYREKVEREQE